MEKLIQLDNLNMQEALRYLGSGGQTPDDAFMALMKDCEKTVLAQARPRYVYRIFDISECDEGVRAEDTDFILRGNSIKKHLKGCKKAAFFAATISDGIDRQLRIAQVSDITKAFVMDSLASVAVEQVCDKFEQILKEQTQGYYQTFRFGLGYGDLPIEQQKDFVALLNAPKQIGLSVSSSFMLIPTKSVTAVIGLSKEPVKGVARGCQTCNMREKCQYRIKGGHCNG